jgi:hypothetical protein
MPIPPAYEPGCQRKGLADGKISPELEVPFEGGLEVILNASFIVRHEALKRELAPYAQVFSVRSSRPCVIVVVVVRLVVTIVIVVVELVVFELAICYRGRRGFC